LTMITNRGTKVYPGGLSETFCVDHWRCRFKTDNKPIRYNQIVELLSKITESGFRIIKTENLCLIDGKESFSAGQGA
jgi:isocitrate dehydrogenase